MSESRFLALQIYLLGGFQLNYDGQPFAGVSQARQQSLLAYLLLHRGVPQSRRHLAFLFWPESTAGQARTNLRNLLYQLRRNLPDADRYLHVHAHTVHWRADASVGLDVADFEREKARADKAGTQEAKRLALADAVNLYRGDLLPDIYDEWIITERERLSQKYIKTLEDLVGLLKDVGDYGNAIRYAQRLLSHDPVREVTFRRLMELHALNGDDERALSVYRTCVATLQRELGVEPGPATLEAYEHVLSRQGLMPMREAPQAAVAPEQIRAPRLIGRQMEWQQLQDAWRRASNGLPQFALIAGEAGIGKTRLAEELLHWAAQRGIHTARTRSYATAGRLSYAPAAEWLRSNVYRELSTGLEDVWLSEVARLLPEILVNRPDVPPPRPLTDGWQRQRLFEALARAALMHKRPLLLQIDDLQWCDQETLEWLHYLLRLNPEAPLLVVGTVRLEEVDTDHPLTSLILNLRSDGQLTEIELRTLDASHTSVLASEVAGHELDQAMATALYDDTQGVPLFVVEAVRAGLTREADRRTLALGMNAPARFPPAPPPCRTSGQLPPKVYAVIQLRLAQLSPAARELASLAAVIGRSFTFDLLVQVSRSGEDAVADALDELWRRGIAQEQGANTYDFSHDRIRDVAYAEISPVQRGRLHRKVAQALETVHVAGLDAVSGQLAEHYACAGDTERAIVFYQQAGTAALRIYANQDAIDLFSHGLALLQTLPATEARRRRELALRLALAPPLRITKGYASSEVEGTLSRARELCQQTGEDLQLFRVLMGLWAVNVVRAQLSLAHEVAQQLVELAQKLKDPALLVSGHLTMGGSLLQLGEYGPAQAHFEQAVGHYDPQQHESQVSYFGANLCVFCRSWGSHALWHLGYPDQSLTWAREAIALAKAHSHPFSLALAQAYAAMLHQFRREIRATQELAAESLTLSTQYTFAYYSVWAAILRAWARAEQRPGAQKLAELRQAVKAFLASESQLRAPYYCGLVARVCAITGRASEGIEILDQALVTSQQNGDRWCDAELYRLKGELLLMVGVDETSAEAYFQQAIELARQQGAKSLELRGAMSLCQLWMARGKRSQARDLLAEVYGWFSEGFDTLDLSEAKALLDELS